MENLYHRTNQSIQDIQAGLGPYEKSAGEDATQIEVELSEKIEAVIQNCERLDNLVNKEPPTRRANAKVRVDQLKYDCKHLQAAFRNVQYKRFQRSEEMRQREELLSTNFTANDTSIYMDGAIQHNSQLKNSNNNIDELIEHGTGILGNLRSQHDTLKGAHKKILDVVNQLGLSNTVIRLIERRTTQDKFLLYGGMIVTCIIMFLVWKHFT